MSNVVDIENWRNMADVYPSEWVDFIKSHVADMENAVDAKSVDDTLTLITQIESLLSALRADINAFGKIRS